MKSGFLSIFIFAIGVSATASELQSVFNFTKAGVEPKGDEIQHQYDLRRAPQVWMTLNYKAIAGYNYLRGGVVIIKGQAADFLIQSLRKTAGEEGEIVSGAPAVRKYSAGNIFCMDAGDHLKGRTPNKHNFCRISFSGNSATQP